MSRGDVLDGLSAGRSSHTFIGSKEKPPRGIVGVASKGDGGYVCSQNAKKDLRSAKNLPSTFTSYGNKRFQEASPVSREWRARGDSGQELS